MSQAIYYINQNSIDQNNSALIDSIPEQAINIPISKVLNKETLLTSLAKVGSFPSYFSHNWDSAWDCLTDSDINYLKIYLNKVEKINTEDFNVFKRIVEDAYHDFGKPQLWVIGTSNDAN